MPYNPGIKGGEIATNEEIQGIFKCSPQGGMRKSNQTNTLVIISDPKKPLYQDEWHGDILHYTGMGTTGDQDIDFMQNKTLKESNRNGIDVFLFEKLSPNKYLFQGQVKLAEEPYESEQIGADGKPRKVWIFPVKLTEGSEPCPIPEEVWLESQRREEKEARKLSDEELRRRALKTREKTQERAIISIQRSRNGNVAQYAKRRAKGKCELCAKSAPFLDRSGEPYLEAHHIIWLARGGPDTIDNTVALCPNCHRRMHVIDDERDKEILSEKIMSD